MSARYALLVVLMGCGPEVSTADASTDAATDGAIDTGIVDEAGRRMLCGDDAGQFPGTPGTCQYGNGPTYACGAGCECDYGPCSCLGGGSWPGCMCPNGGACILANCGNVICLEGCVCLDPAKGTCFCPIR